MSAPGRSLTSVCENSAEEGLEARSEDSPAPKARGKQQPRVEPGEPKTTQEVDKKCLARSRKPRVPLCSTRGY